MFFHSVINCRKYCYSCIGYNINCSLNCSLIAVCTAQNCSAQCSVAACAHCIVKCCTISVACVFFSAAELCISVDIAVNCNPWALQYSCCCCTLNSAVYVAVAQLHICWCTLSKAGLFCSVLYCNTILRCTVTHLLLHSFTVAHLVLHIE